MPMRSSALRSSTTATTASVRRRSGWPPKGFRFGSELEGGREVADGPAAEDLDAREFIRTVAVGPTADLGGRPRVSRRFHGSDRRFVETAGRVTEVLHRNSVLALEDLA